MIILGSILAVVLAGCSPGESVPAAPSSTPTDALVAPTPTITPEPPAAPPTLSPTAEAFIGQWMNLERDGGGYPWFTIRQEDAEMVAHFWGECSPEPCDIGEYRFPIAELDDGEFVFSYEFSRGTHTSVIALQDDMSVEITTTIEFTEDSDQEDRVIESTYGDAQEVEGILAYVGIWVYDQAVNDEYSRLSVSIDSGEFVITAQAIIDGEVQNFGPIREGFDGVDDGDLYIDFDYPGGGLISGECVPNGAGGLDVEMFVEYMLDDVYTTHEATFTMRRLD